MQNDEYTPELEQDENEIQEVEETVYTEESTDDQNTDSVDWKSEALKWQAIAKRKAKQVSAKPEQKTLETNINNNYLTREEGILIAKGMDDELITQLKAIAKGKNISLLEAEKDTLFQALFDKVQKERKSEQAKLGASKGSSFKQEKPSFTPGLTREEHLALWKETQN